MLDHQRPEMRAILHAQTILVLHVQIRPFQHKRAFFRMGMLVGTLLWSTTLFPSLSQEAVAVGRPDGKGPSLLRLNRVCFRILVIAAKSG